MPNNPNNIGKLPFPNSGIYHWFKPWLESRCSQVQSCGKQPAFPDELDPVALARYLKAKRNNNKGIESLYPAWLKAHIKSTALPQPFELDLSWHIPGMTQAQINELRKLGLDKPFREPIVWEEE